METVPEQYSGTDSGPVSLHTERYLALLESGDDSDLTIFAGKDRIPVRAHKWPLRVASRVLKDKLNTVGSSEELAGDQNGTGINVTSLEMPELSKDEVMTFLKFVYVEEKPEDVESALPLLQAARKYGIPELAQHCVLRLLASKITDQNALHLYEQAKSLEDESLQKSTLDHILRCASKIVESQQFLMINVNTLKTLLESDNLAVLDELQLFEAVMRWADAEIERQDMIRIPRYVRSVLEKVIHLIRFPLMTSADFAMKVVTAQVLTPNELAVMAFYFFIPVLQRQTMGIRRFKFKANRREYYSPTGNTFKVSLGNTVQPLKSKLSLFGRGPTRPSPSTGINKVSQGRVEKTIPCQAFYSSKHAYNCVTLSRSSKCTTQFRVNVPIWIRSLALNFGCLNSPDLSLTFGMRDDLELEIVDESGKLLSERTIRLDDWAVADLRRIQLHRDLLITKDALYLIKFRLNSRNACKYYSSNLQNVVEHEDAEGGSKVRFDFTGTVASEQFFEGLEITFLVD